MTKAGVNPGVYLSSYLAPLRPWLDRPDVTDVWVNEPGSVWIETIQGRTQRFDAPELTETILARLARQIAGAASQGVSREQPLLSASLPDGSRVQVISPPATRGHLVLAVRKHALSDLTLAEMSQGGTFRLPPTGDAQQEVDRVLQSLLDQGDVEGFLGQAVRARKTMVIAGGTSSGKTTLLNALVKEIPAHERLVVIEDTPEIRLVHDNSIGLLAARGDAGEARVDVEDLLQASLRLRPDRILLGELRGREAFAFLRAVNTGHPGSITTIHADTPQGAIDQIAMLALLSGIDVGWEPLRAYARQVIDVIVQMGREDGIRRVTDIAFGQG